MRDLPMPPATARIAADAVADAAPATPLPQRAVALQAAVLAQSDTRAAATAFVTQLAAMFGCARATLGFVDRGVIELVAVSQGLGDELLGEAFEAIAMAQEECVQQLATVRCPAAPNARSVVRLAHGRLVQRHGGAAASVVVLYQGAAVGAVSAEWAALPADFDRLLHDMEALVGLVGPLLHLTHQRGLPLRRRATAAARRAWQRARAGGDRRLALIAAAAVLLVGGLVAAPLPYSVGGHARIEGAQQRTLVAPADGYLQVVHARPGDTVQRGQVLAEMADQDLTLQRRKWASELDQQRSAYAVALARADRPALAIAAARSEQARAQLELVEADLARVRIVAPIDGIVIQGDLSQQIGAPLERGKPLMMVAPSARYRVVVEIDERDIAAVAAGQRGTLALSALPWDTLPIRVARVTPIAKTSDGHNVFEVEAELDAPAPRLRAGLEGAAKFRVGEAPLAWTWGRRAIGWLAVKTWAWWA